MYLAGICVPHANVAVSTAKNEFFLPELRPELIVVFIISRLS
jgi:hypothetical protein